VRAHLQDDDGSAARYALHLQRPARHRVFKLKGGGKSAWVFQNLHPSWSSLFGTTFTIDDIPAATTQVSAYDGNGLVYTVSTPPLQKPSHTFPTPLLGTSGLGKTWLFIGDAE
jgi:hypothetical protein